MVHHPRLSEKIEGSARSVKKVGTRRTVDVLYMAQDDPYTFLKRSGARSP